MYEEVAAFIKTLGFPIFVAVVLLLRYERRLTEMALLLRELTTAIKVLASLEDEPEDDEAEEPE